MTIAEVLLVDYDNEMENTRRTLERIPEADPAWKPHEKSMPIGRLAVHVATLPQFLTSILTTPELELTKGSFPPLVFESTAKLLSELAQHSAEARGILEAASDDALQVHWKLLFGGKMIVEGPRMLLYRTMFLNHLVHHRAQLGVYLRLQGIAVPGLYGPSADEPFS